MKVTINPVGNLINATTAETNIDNNFDAIQTAIENTLSRDGTPPNQMESVLDMNSNQIINLPAPTSLFSPVRLQDIADLETGGTINVSNLPTGGTTGQVLKKNSNTDFDAGWETSHYLTAGGSSGQVLAKNSATDYDASWVSPGAALTPGGASNSIQYNSASTFAGLLLSAGQNLMGTSGAPIGVLPTLVDVVDAYGIDNTGVSNVGAALQTAINTITTAGSIVYIPNGTYLMGNSSLSIPSYATIICHPNATLRRTSDASYSDYTGSMIYWTGTQVKWFGGILENTTVLATSTTSNTINTSAKTFTTQADLPLVAGSSFVRIWSASHPEARFEGVVSSYAGTTLTLNTPFKGGSGTYSDWNIGIGHVYQTAMCLHGGDRSKVEGVRVTGNWYTGIILDGYLATGSTPCQNNTFERVFIDGVQNRGFSIYGTCYENMFLNCHISGRNIFPGCTDYGFNFNPANPVGTTEIQLRNKVIGCSIDSCGFQGIGAGDQVFYMTIDGCTVSNMTETSAMGIGYFYANVTAPQYSKVSNCLVHNVANGYQLLGTFYIQVNGCTAVACNNGYVIGPSVQQAQFCHINDSGAYACTANGFTVQGNSVRCDLSDVAAISNTSVGISIQAGASVTIANGRANGNGTNYSDGGTGTVSSVTTA